MKEEVLQSLSFQSGEGKHEHKTNYNASRADDNNRVTNDICFGTLREGEMESISHFQTYNQLLKQALLKEHDFDEWKGGRTFQTDETAYEKGRVVLPVFGGGEQNFVVNVNMFGVGKRSKLGKNERDQRKIMDLRGSRLELLSQLPSHMKLEKTVSGCCGGLSLCPLFRTETFILQLPDVLTADSLSPFEVVLHGCSSHPVTGQ